MTSYHLAFEGHQRPMRSVNFNLCLHGDFLRVLTVTLTKGEPIRSVVPYLDPSFTCLFSIWAKNTHVLFCPNNNRFNIDSVCYLSIVTQKGQKYFAIYILSQSRPVLQEDRSFSLKKCSGRKVTLGRQEEIKPLGQSRQYDRFPSTSLPLPFFTENVLS